MRWMNDWANEWTCVLLSRKYCTRPCSTRPKMFCYLTIDLTGSHLVPQNYKEMHTIPTVKFWWKFIRFEIMKPWHCNVREVAQLHRFRFSMETVTDDLPVKLDGRDVFFNTWPGRNIDASTTMQNTDRICNINHSPQPSAHQWSVKNRKTRTHRT